PQATVKLSNLVFATPAPPEWDHLVLAVLVQGRDQPLELTAVFGARVLDPESIVGLREGTLGPGFKGAALQSGLRHISKDIKGPLTTPIGKGIRSVNVALRKELDLYALVRPCKSYPGVRSRYDNIDLIIVRENTEDIYAGIEFQEGKPETEQMIKEISAATG